MDEEPARLAETYGGFASDRRRRRAWDGSRPGNRLIRAELIANLLEAIAPSPGDGSHYLDVGCGGGWWLRELAARGVTADRLHGVDLIGERVSAARRSLPESDIRLADARRLPYEDETFGAVTALTAFSSMLDKPAARAAARESVRALEPGGLMVAYEPALPAPGRRRLTLTPGELAGWCAPDATLSRVTRLTLAPPLARAAAAVDPRLYDAFSRVPPLLTSRLVVLRKRPLR